MVEVLSPTSYCSLVVSIFNPDSWCQPALPAAVSESGNEPSGRSSSRPTSARCASVPRLVETYAAGAPTKQAKRDANDTPSILVEQTLGKLPAVAFGSRNQTIRVGTDMIL